MVEVTVLLEVELTLQNGESEIRIIEVKLKKPNEFLSKLMNEVTKVFVDDVQLPQGATYRIYILNEKDKQIRVTSSTDTGALFKWHGVYFDTNALTKLRVQIQEEFRSSSVSSMIQQPSSSGLQASQSSKSKSSSNSPPIASDSDDDLIPPTNPTRKPGIRIIKQGKIILKTGDTSLKGIPELKKQFEEREITLTDITAKEIGIKTGLDEEKIKKILEYHDLSDNEANEDYADLVVVKRVLDLFDKYNWDGEKLLADEDNDDEMN